MSLPSAVFALQTPNLGDDLQAMAIAGFCPSVTSVFHRERIGEHQLDRDHSVVMNYWFMSKGFKKAPHPSVKPIFHGFCVGRDEMMKYDWPDYLKKHEPIGCRDHKTVELLGQRGIDCYWSGCITLFLGETLQPVADADREGIYMVDVPPEAEPLIPKDLREQAERITNYCPVDIVNDPVARWARIARINDKLRRAKLVITKRLHTSMPCVSFGTPVVLVVDGDPKNFRRFNGYQDFVPMLVHRSGKQENELDWTDIRPAVIPDQIRGHFETLKRNIREQTGGLNLDRAPNFYKTVRLTIPNPGLGDMPGTVQIDLGTQTITRLPQHWSNREIVLDIEAFHAFERFDMPVSLLPYDPSKGKWYRASRAVEPVPVGTVHELASASAGA